MKPVRSNTSVMGTTPNKAKEDAKEEEQDIDRMVVALKNRLKCMELEIKQTR